MLRELIEAGADVFRLNFSHGTPEEHAENVRRIRAVGEEVGREVGILGRPARARSCGSATSRTASPSSTRARTWSCDGETNGTPGNAELPPGPVGRLRRGGPRGRPGLPRRRPRPPEGVSIEGGEVTCEVEAGGAVGSHQGVNLPGADADLPETGAADQAWVDFAFEHGIDLLAVSFVRRPADLEPVEARLRERGADIPLIAKIEKPQAAERAEEIIEAAGSGIMVARGDLGIELPIEEVPGAQKRLIALAGRASKPAITATQMLATMVGLRGRPAPRSPTSPTRSTTAPTR